jgi:L-fuculose-phosphate aldolase
MSPMLEELRRRVLAAARSMARSGLTRGTSGNVSARDPETGLVAVTPTAMPYGELTEEDIAVIDLEGRRVAGARKPSSEVPMHAQVYRDRPWAGGIVHTHSTYATTLAVLGRPIPPLHYAIATLGPEVPVAPYATYGSRELARGASATLGEGCRAALLQNHGVLAVGGTVEEALRNAETVEFLAELYWRALAAGEPLLLERGEIDRVREKLRTYTQA